LALPYYAVEMVKGVFYVAVLNDVAEFFAS